MSARKLISDRPEEITMPGTPETLLTMRALVQDVHTALSRLDRICDALDRIEKRLETLEREQREDRARADKAVADAARALREAAFATKRVDALVARVQAAEGRAR